ncbi:hypothetical protein Pyn_37505 [Prunus yedoensis var. nudiflora]|uniref:Uncharacterized protein n=1 Tax=Prunus yedoensis var. nudiflora TaxID=2094558 RepID=A0A314V365_PRUYE|nr:hypothetical protein Pyn_37505 [Prunus yedoensis var. nudiflora]
MFSCRRPPQLDQVESLFFHVESLSFLFHVESQQFRFHVNSLLFLFHVKTLSSLLSSILGGSATAIVPTVSKSTATMVQVASLGLAVTVDVAFLMPHPSFVP